MWGVYSLGMVIYSVVIWPFYTPDTAVQAMNNYTDPTPVPIYNPNA